MLCYYYDCRSNWSRNNDTDTRSKTVNTLDTLHTAHTRLYFNTENKMENLYMNKHDIGIMKFISWRRKFYSQVPSPSSLFIVIIFMTVCPSGPLARCLPPSFSFCLSLYGVQSIPSGIECFPFEFESVPAACRFTISSIFGLPTSLERCSLFKFIASIQWRCQTTFSQNDGSRDNHRVVTSTNSTEVAA